MKHPLLSSFLASFLSLGALAACGGGSKTATNTTATSSSASDPSCPMTIPGTSVSVEDTDSGAALVFATTGDVGELRKRVAAMAQMHNEHHGSMGALPTGKEAGGEHAGHDMSNMSGHDMSSMGSGHDMSSMGSGHDMSSMGSGHDMNEHEGHAGGMISVHSKAESVDVDGGSRLVFTSSTSDVAKLQSELRMHAQHLSSGTCTMGHH